MPDTQGVSPAINVPSAKEMEMQIAQVPQSGSNLQTNLEFVQSNPVELTPEQQAAAKGVILANTNDPVEPAQDTVKKVFEYVPFLKKWAVKAVAILLTLQSLHGIYKSVLFILVEYPILEQQLVMHQVTQDQVNDFGIKAIMMVISTVLSMFFAMRLTFLKTKAAKTVSTLIGILLFIGNAMIHDYFTQLNSSQVMVDWIIYTINLIQGTPEKVIENTPFLEEAIDGTVNTVWYK